MRDTDLRCHLEELRKTYVYPTKVALYNRPLSLVRGKGTRVWDQDGQEYLDAIGGIVCISVGHNHPKIKQKILSMLAEDEIQHTSHLYLSLYMEGLAEKLAKLAPGLPRSCYITNSGSEANEMAVLTARVATGEQMMIALRHSYHGGTNATLGLCGNASWKYPHQGGGGVAHAVAPYCYRCPFGANNKTCDLECSKDVRSVVETVTSGKVAGIIVEPILGVGGFIDPPREYHAKVFDIIKSFGGIYISDEVQTGVGRTGESFFAIEQSGVVPDIVTMAKGLGSGAPIGAVIADRSLANELNGKHHFSTFGGDPYQSMQAAMVVDIIEEEKLMQNAENVGARLKAGLLDLQEQFPIIGDVRGRGLLLGFELVKDPLSKEPATDVCKQLLELCKGEGLLLGKGGLWGHVVRIAPPLNLSFSEADELLLKLKKAFIKLVLTP
ncbi:MAG: aspartate aminotransferase family protein [Oligoflexales bacterium]